MASVVDEALQSADRCWPHRIKLSIGRLLPQG